MTPLTNILKEYIAIHWSEFLRREKDPALSNSSSVITSLIRACYKGNLRAIQEGLDRIDGKVVQELEVVLPTFYTVYPYATGKLPTDDTESIPFAHSSSVDSLPTVDLDHPSFFDPTIPPPSDEDLSSEGLRDVLSRMLEAPKGVVEMIMTSAELQDEGKPSINDPLVSSVMMAGLMRLVHNDKINAVIEVVEQIDGRVKETLKLLGDDIFIVSYDTLAPANATKNKQGIYQVENKQTTTIWGERLEGGGRRQLHR